MKNSLETRLGIFVILAVFAAWAIVETLGSADLFRHGYRVSALFNTVQDLKAGNSVKMAGVEIGRVEKIVLVNDKASVTMRLHSDAVVKKVRAAEGLNDGPSGKDRQDHKNAKTGFK